MNVSETEIDSILRAKDIEGLLPLGAPDNEYFIEAAEIALALQSLSLKEVNDDEVSDRVMRVWSRFFGPFSPEEMRQRSSVLHEVVRAIQETSRRNEAAQHSSRPVFIS